MVGSRLHKVELQLHSKFQCILTYIHLDRVTFSSQRRRTEVEKTLLIFELLTHVQSLPFSKRRMQIRVTTMGYTMNKARRGPAANGQLSCQTWTAHPSMYIFSH